MDEAALDEFCRGVKSLLREVHPAATTGDDAWAEFRASLAVVSDPSSHDLEDRSTGSLTRADALRIRAAKFIALNLPPGLFAEPSTRRRVRATLAELTRRAVGAAEPSRYLDGAGRDGAGD